MWYTRYTCICFYIRAMSYGVAIDIYVYSYMIMQCHKYDNAMS